MNQTESYRNFFFFKGMSEFIADMPLDSASTDFKEGMGKTVNKKKLVEFVTHKKHIQQGLCEG